VANLLEEVQEIQSEPVRIAEAEITQVEEVSPSPRVAERVAERVAIAPTQTNETANAVDPSLLAVAPLSPDAYIPAQRSPTGQLVSPDMPLLPEADEFLPEAPDYFNGYIWPTRGTLTSGYGWRWGRMHRGVDVAGPVGTPIVAAASGVVERAGWNSGGYGNLVEIRHPDGSLTLYAHNNRLNVSTGQAVKQGQQVAEMGSTGYSTGPHLHFEVHLNGKGAVNPIAHLPSR
jgi:murein DD-endopeptidase MepM/ murein hydrolase activator NlpD